MTAYVFFLCQLRNRSFTKYKIDKFPQKKNAHFKYKLRWANEFAEIQ